MDPMVLLWVSFFPLFKIAGKERAWQKDSGRYTHGTQKTRSINLCLEVKNTSYLFFPTWCTQDYVLIRLSMGYHSIINTIHIICICYSKVHLMISISFMFCSSTFTLTMPSERWSYRITMHEAKLCADSLTR